MASIQTWLVDFDETLAAGSLTWAFQEAFPKFVREHHLSYDTQRLKEVMRDLQQRANQEADPAPLLQHLFEAMQWPHHLQNQLFDDLLSNYPPTLFDDAIPFLTRLREKGHRVYIVSNNRRSPQYVPLLGLEEYILQIVTPHTCPGTQPKPHQSLWRYIADQDTAIDPQQTFVVGNDPWSDGAFAEACGLPCWIVDRMNQFSDMHDQKSYSWVQSLLEIPL